MEFEDRVNDAIKNATKDDAGKTVFAEGTSEEVKYAASTEMRRRDTSTTNEKLTEAWAEDVAATLSSSQQAELEELKNTDPDEWRVRLNDIEAENKQKLQDKQKKIKEIASQESEVERRERLLAEHNEAYPNAQITQEAIDNDVPPRLVKKLEQGDISWEDFLTESSKFIESPKVIKDLNAEPGSGDPDLSDLGGDDKPTHSSVESDIEQSYANEIF